MILAFSRFTLVIGGLLGGFAATRFVDWQSELGLPRYYVIFLLIILGGSDRIRSWRHRRPRAHLSVAQGPATVPPNGICRSTVGHRRHHRRSRRCPSGVCPLRLLKPEWLSTTVTVLLTITAAYVSAGVALSRRRDLVAIFPRLAPPGARHRWRACGSARHECRYRWALPRAAPAWLHARQAARSPVRALGATGRSLTPPTTIDGRGRRGLDLLSSLPSEMTVEVFEADYPDTPQVDDKLMRLAVDAKCPHRHGRLQPGQGRSRPRPRSPQSQRRRFRAASDLPARRKHPPPYHQDGQEAEQGVGHLDDGTHGCGAGVAAPIVGKDTDVEVDFGTAADFCGQDDLRPAR